MFDLDGTLVDTVDARVKAWMIAFAEENVPAEDAAIASLIGSDGKRLAREVGRLANEFVNEQRADRIDARAGALYSELCPEPKALPGVTELLDGLDRAGVKWVIGTSSRRAQIGPSIRALGRPDVLMIVDGGQVRRAKPDPELMYVAARSLGVEPGNCWCVGDSVWDVYAGNAAGMTTVAVVAGSATTKDALQRAGATIVVSTLTDLVPIFGAP